MDGYVPVTADSVPCFILGDVNQGGILGFQLLDDLSRAVGGVVIDDDHVERVRCSHFLRKG